MSSSRRPGGSGDSILASLERGPGGTRTHRNWLIVGGSAAILLTLMLAWIAYSNATSVRTLPQSAVQRPLAPADEGMAGPPIPSLSIPAPEAAAIVDERPAAPPPMVMLPAEDAGRETRAPAARAQVAALPAEPKAARPVPRARQAAAKPAAAHKQVARSGKAAAERPLARAPSLKKPKPAAQAVAASAAAADIDSDVALISAIVAHSSRHAAERAQVENCTGKKCPRKSSTSP